MSGQIVLTGADGYLGRQVATRLLAASSDRLTLMVRANDNAELATKKAFLWHELGGAEGMTVDRVDVVATDLRQPEPFASIDANSVTCIVHAAANTAFNVEQSVAQQVNVDGTRRLAEFARQCPKLERLLMLSTLYSSGHQVGTVEEVPHGEGFGFANYYEWSKYEAERHLLASCANLPLSIARLATIVADDDTGAVAQYNAFHNTLKLFFYGLLSLMPGDPATPLYFATADFTSRGLLHLLRPETPAGIYHLAPSLTETITLGEWIHIVFDVFDTDPGFRRRRLLRPEFCDIESFRDLVAVSEGFSISPMAQAIKSVAPFAEQMFLAKDFDNRRLRCVWPGYSSSEPQRLVESACTQLVRTRWGRTPEQTVKEIA